jgi:glycosyltransferase involved in cell wall biosynthesis
MHLILFFTRGVSLETWASVGSLEREIAIYLRLQEKGVRVTFVTFGSASDLDYQDQLGGIKILCNKWGLPLRWYERLLPFLHASALVRVDIIKTNQTNGADLALRAARIWRKPLIARCGYIWSEFAQRRNAQQEVAYARKIEKQVFENAQRVVVTTHAMKAYVEANYTVDVDRVIVIPNYVLTNLFSPGKTRPATNRICCIGRLDEQKNLHALVKACQGLPVQLHLVGDGHLRAALSEEASRCSVDLVLHGNLPHNELPEMVRQSTIFALVSFYEGHPKALLEAMSCGAVVLAADSPGIREEIIHGDTGWLVGADADSIRAGIQHLLENPALREKLGRNARNYILATCSLDKIVDLEYAIYQDILLRKTASVE